MASEAMAIEIVGLHMKKTWWILPLLCGCFPQGTMMERLLFNLQSINIETQKPTILPLFVDQFPW